MNGYIKKQALMDYCSNQVTRTIDLNDIARFPILEVFTKDEVIAMLTEIYEEISSVKTADIGEVIVKGECKNVIQKKINSLRENTDDTRRHRKI